MIGFIKKLLGMTPSTDYKTLIQQGAVILDVRTIDEYKGGHIKGSVNIPVQNLGGHDLKGIDKNKPVITCCASGMRSASAKSILQARGYSEVYNGGGWLSLRSKI